MVVNCQSGGGSDIFKAYAAPSVVSTLKVSFHIAPFFGCMFLAWHKGRGRYPNINHRKLSHHVFFGKCTTYLLPPPSTNEVSLFVTCSVAGWVMG